MKCPKCSKQFSGDRGLKIHIGKAHNAVSPTQLIPPIKKMTRSFREVTGNQNSDKENVVTPKKNLAPRLGKNLVLTPKKILAPIPNKTFKKKEEKPEDKTEKPQNGFHCDICPHSFRSENYLERHKNVAHQNNEHKCEFCHKIFGTKRTLKNHEIQCQNSKALQIYTGKSKVVTEIIHKKVIETQKAAENTKIEPTKALTLYTKTNCDRCGRNFASARGLMTHQRSCKATFDCDKCPAKLETKHQLDSHIKYCHDILEEMEREVILYHCDNCDAKFPEKQTLLLHMQFYHVTGPPVAPPQPQLDLRIPCDRCDLKFPKAENLVLHYKLIHLNEKLTCDRCHREFENLHTLIKHKSLNECGNLAIKMEMEI